MKNIFIVLTLFAFVACQPKLDFPAKSSNNINLNSLTTLEIGDNEFFVSDFVLDYETVDSITASSEHISFSLNEQKNMAIATVAPEMEAFVDVKIWVKGTPFSVPCRKSDKQEFVFSYNPGTATPKRVQIAGQMNDWTASNTPDLVLNENGLYEIKLMLSPGTYLYQMAIDGDQNHDANNPDKVDNGFGKYNSILEVKGNAHLAPRLFSDRYSESKIVISFENEVENIFIYWQNYRLPAKFIKITDNTFTFDIPAEANILERSHIRVWASNSNGASNDLFIPLHNGKVLTDAKNIKRTDKHAQIMYFMLVDRFKNGNPNNDAPLNRPDVDPRADYRGGDLAGLQSKIEDGYFEKLGVNSLWVSPVNQNPTDAYGFYKDPKTGFETRFSGYHGYWPISSSKVDFRFGSNDELKTLVSKAHGKQINVLLDYVANHVHEDHPFYRNNPELATSLYLPDGTMNVEKWDEQRLTTWFDTFMPSLDFSNPKVVETMTDSAIWWVNEFNIDGFRHDACKHVNLEFWRTLTHKMRKQFPDKMNYQIGETYGSPRLIASYLTTGMLDGQFDFNVYDIANTTFAGVGGSDLNRVKSVLDASFQNYGHHNLMGYISGNHDKARFMAYASGDVAFGEDAKAAGWSRNIGITDSIAYDKFLVFHAFNYTIPGIPVLYYGDEIGLTGGNDPDSRRMMRFEGLNKREAKLLEAVSKLGQLRRNNPVLIYGSFINIETTANTWVYARKYFDKEAIVVLNNTASEKTFSIDLPAILKSAELKANFGNKYQISNGKLQITLPAYGIEILM